jgi:signal transduction histidine kinase
MSATRGAAPGSDEADQTAKLCHDLRQYVAAGLMLAEGSGSSGLDPDVDRRLATIARVFEDIESLLQEQSGGPRPLVTVDLADLVEDCVALTNLISKVPVEVRLDARPLPVRASPPLLRRALLNVLNNATRAAGVGGRVSVTARRSGEHVWVQVSDDGAGFGRIPGVNGYGMSVVEAAVGAAHGRLEIYSGPGPGTSVRLRLPRPRPASAAS